LPPKVAVIAPETLAETVIPLSPSFSTRLFGCGCEAVRGCHYDAIVGWYFEPFGVVAAQLGRIFDLPVILLHAGSDLGRLANHSSFRSAFTWALAASTKILSAGTRGIPNEILEGLGMKRDQFHQSYRSRLSKAFEAVTEPIDARSLIDSLSSWYGRLRDVVPAAAHVATMNCKPVPNGTRLGLVGKVGTAKRSLETLRALNELAERGEVFTFFAAIAGEPHLYREFIEYVLAHARLRDLTFILPPLPPWLMPSFYRMLDLTCFLESGFPISFHNPIGPREAMASGSCLLLSSELVKKQVFSSWLSVGGNHLAISKPHDVKQLTKVLTTVVRKRSMIQTIGSHGRCLSRCAEREFFVRRGLARSIIDAITKIKSGEK
jgi:hypothetical protein